jgi:DUF1680 family protein
MQEEEVYVNLFMNSEVSFQTPSGELIISQQTGYPWKGNVELAFQNEKEMEANLHIRIPGWATNHPVPSDLFHFTNDLDEDPVLEVNGKEVKIESEKGYVVLKGKWKQGDRISLELPMKGRTLAAHEEVHAKTGLLAVQHGPLLYCAEEIDNQMNVLEAELGSESSFEARFIPGLLEGVNILEGEDLTLVPYYAWANREVGKMNVWFKQKQ